MKKGSAAKRIGQSFEARSEELRPVPEQPPADVGPIFQRFNSTSQDIKQLYTQIAGFHDWYQPINERSKRLIAPVFLVCLLIVAAVHFDKPLKIMSAIFIWRFFHQVSKNMGDTEYWEFHDALKNIKTEIEKLFRENPNHPSVPSNSKRTILTIARKLPTLKKRDDILNELHRLDQNFDSILPTLQSVSGLTN